MQLSDKESAKAFWDGAKQGLVRSMGYIAAIGLPVAACIFMAWIPPVSITVAAISVLTTALTVGMFSGQQALAQHHQLKHNAMHEARITQLERGAGHVFAQDVAVERPVHSPKISTILEHGASLDKASFAEVEEERAEQPKPTRTVH